jgi:predicted metal-dependent peptidase
MFSYYKDKNFNRLSDIYTVLLEAEEDSQDNSDTMSVEQARKFESLITRAKHKLRKNLPFFGVLLSKLRTVPTRSIPTMAVDDYNNIYINPDFALKTLSEPEVVGVLAHEAFHIANGTFMRLNNREMKLWNVATDYTMNRDLLDDMAKINNKEEIGFPSMGLIPEKRGDKYIISFKNNPATAQLPDIDITDMAPETLYRVLENLRQQFNQNQKGKPQQGGGGQGGKPQQGAGGQGQGPGGKGQGEKGESEKGDGKDLSDILSDEQEKLDKHLTDEEAKNLDILKMPQGEGVEGGEDFVPRGPAGGESSKNESQKKSETKHLINQTQAEINRTRGSGTGSPRGVSDVLQAKSDWRVLLRDFMAKSERTYYDLARPRKRALASGYYAPKKVNRREVRVIIGLDTSGSITDKEINTFVSEIVKLAEQFDDVKAVILLWNTTVYYNYLLDTTTKSVQVIRNELMKLPYESGGTYLSSIKTWFDQNKDKLDLNEYNGLLVFTDGYVEDNPQIPNIQNKLFMIITGGSDQILKSKGLPTAIVDVPPTR